MFIETLIIYLIAAIVLLIIVLFPFFIKSIYSIPDSIKKRKLEKDEIAKKEIKKQEMIRFLSTGSCRELACVPTDTVFNEFHDPVYSEGESLKVVIPKTGTCYHRPGCKCLLTTGKHSITSIYNITAAYYCPCSVCRPPVPKDAPEWLHKYKHFLSLKRQYDLSDPDLYPGCFPIIL